MLSKNLSWPSSALGKSDRVCVPKLTQAIWPDFGEQVAVSVFGRFFHVIDDQELAGTLGPLESQPEFSEHGIDRWCGKFIREVGSMGRVLHLEVKLFRDSRLVNHHAARQAESLGKLRHGPPGQVGLDKARSRAFPGLGTPRFLAWRQ
jgi:hypothetical protein